jgi:hypothetical protein
MSRDLRRSPVQFRTCPFFYWLKVWNIDVMMYELMVEWNQKHLISYISKPKNGGVALSFGRMILFAEQ